MATLYLGLHIVSLIFNPEVVLSGTHRNKDNSAFQNAMYSIVFYILYESTPFFFFIQVSLLTVTLDVMVVLCDLTIAGIYQFKISFDFVLLVVVVGEDMINTLNVHI